MADSKKKEKEVKKDSKPGFFTTVSAEFKKIIWPTRESAIRQSVVVTVVAVILGTLVAFFDFLLIHGVDFLHSIGA